MQTSGEDMANLQTHFQVTALVSGVASTAFVSAGYLSVGESFLCWVFAVVGGLLPDMDTDDNRSSQILFSILTVVACGLAAFLTLRVLPLLAVWAICILLFIAIRFGLRYVFANYTEHRGVLHTLVSVAFFAVCTTIVAHILGATSTASWFYGLFMGFGYFIHLVLDEVYKVNFINEPYSKPFGSAIKLLDQKSIKPTLILLVVTLALTLFTPSYAEFINILFNPSTYGQVLAAMI